MTTQPPRDDESDAEHSRQVQSDLGFFQDSELFVVLLGAIFGGAIPLALASLLLKSKSLAVMAGLLGAYFGGIRIPCRIYGKGRLKAGFLHQLDELTKELNQALRGQLVETIFAVVWMGALAFFFQAWQAENAEKLKELGVFLVLLPIVIVVRWCMRSRFAKASESLTATVVSPAASAALQDSRDHTELRHMTRIVFLFAGANVALAICFIVWDLATEPITLARLLGIAVLFCVAGLPSAFAFKGGFAMVERRDWKRAMWGPKAIMAVLWPLPIFSQVFGYVAYSKLNESGVRELFASERRDAGGR